MVAMLLATQTTIASPRKIFGSIHSTKICPPVKREILRERLGEHFNANYMFDKIPDDEELDNKSPDRAYSRSQEEDKRSFKEDGEFGEENVSTRKRKIYKVNFHGLLPNTTNSWVCSTRKLDIDLGLNYYPRYYRAIQCSQTSCYRFYSCRQVLVPLKFLKLRPGACRKHYGNGATVEDMWELKSVNVPVACQCGY